MKQKLQLLIICLILLAVNVNAQTKKVLILGADGIIGNTLDVKNKLDSTNRFLQVDIFQADAANPTLAYLQTYDAILTWGNSPYFDPTAIGDTLAAYIAAGGDVVNAAFNSYSIGNYTPTGGFSAYKLLNNSNSTIANLYSDTVVLPNHPIMNNVDSFYLENYALNGNVTSGANVVLKYNNGTPLIIAKTNVGPANARRAFLNFYPPSNSVQFDSWHQNTDGTLIMANALDWVSDISTNIKENETNNAFTLYPNPTTSKLTLNISASINEQIEKVSIIDITGKTIKAIVTNSNTVDVSDLVNGIYFIQIQTENNVVNKRFIKK